MVNTVLHTIDDSLEATRVEYSNFFEQDMDYISYLDGTNGHVVYGIAIRLKEDALDGSELKGFMDNVSNYMGVDVFNDRIKDYSPVRVFSSENNRIVIPLYIGVKEWEWDGTTEKPTVDTTELRRSGQLYTKMYPNGTGVNTTLVDASSYVFDYYTPKEDQVFQLAGDTGAMKFLAIAEQLAQHYEELNAKGGHAESVPDVNNLMNLLYNEYDVGEPLVISWQASMVNHFADLRTLSTDGEAPQYLGGNDVSVNLVIKTQDEATARKLTNIPKEISRLTRKYHMVMPCVPLRVDSEFTRFLGVNEVTVENATISTTENYPGLYTVTMELISLDRTVREREAAVRRAIHNDGWNKDTSSPFRSWWNTDSWSGLWNAVVQSADTETLTTIGALVVGGVAGLAKGGLIGAGVRMAYGATGAVVLAGLKGLYDEYGPNGVSAEDDFGDGSDNNKRINQYFELRKALGENDLYPDLELPTIQEMKDVGYYFVRYKFEDERVYVDPDFYFVYPVALQSHVYRELVIHGMDNNFADTKLTDATGACVTVTPNFQTGYKVIESNNIAQDQQEIARKRRIAQQQLQERNSREQDDLKKQNAKKQEATLDMATMLDRMMERDSWKVCDKINCMFLEKRFKKELESYLAAQTVMSAENTNDNIGTANATNAEESATASADDQSALDADKTPSEQVLTEGEHVYNRLQKSQEAADKFLTYLQDTSIDQMSTVISTDFSWVNKEGDDALTDIGNAVSTFLEVPDVQDFLSELNVEVTDEFKACVASVVKAAACNGSGKKEYSAKNTGDWKPRNSFIGQVAGVPGNNRVHAIEIDTRKIAKQGEDESLEDKINQVILCGISFGVFGIKMYSAEQMHNMLVDSKDETFIEENLILIPEDYNKDFLRYTINTNKYLLDPHYRLGTTTLTDVDQYKSGCICSVVYCTFAYMRLLMYWLYRLVKRYAIPTLSVDVFSTVTKLQQEVAATTSGVNEVIETSKDGTVPSKERLSQAITEAQDNYNHKGTGGMLLTNSDGTITAIQKYIDFFNKDVVYLHVGKLWTAAILASVDGDSEIIKRIDNRDYDALNSIVQSCSTVKTEIDVKANVAASSIRKMVLALVGLQMITSMNAIGINQTLPNVRAARNTQQNLYLEAAENPKQYPIHIMI